MKALPIKNQLHGNPSQPLQFSQKIKDKKGETLDLPCPDATRAMVALMDMQAVIGGAASHFGGPSAFAEIMSATHGYMFSQANQKKKQWHELFHFVNDAGHCENGIYALKANYQVAGLTIDSLKGFRSIESQLTGHGEAHLFPESVYISNGPLGSGLPQAQGLAAAEGLSDSPRVTITAISDGACMEGEAKEAFAAIPGLALKKQMGPFVCLVSDNNTKLSGRIDEDSFSMQPTFESFKALGWDVTFVEDGHNLETVYQNIETVCEKAISQPKKPQLIWFKTIKGKGVEKTEKSSSGGHGFPLKKATELAAFIQEIYKDEKIPAVFEQWMKELETFSPPKSDSPSLSGERVKIQKGVADALNDQYAKGLPILSVSADLQGSTGVSGFRDKHPEASLEVGVAEANMVSMAVGLSKQGYIPIVDTFAQFGVTKGSLPLIMSGLSEAPIIAVYSHTGFQDAADGASHQAITYVSMMASIPNVDVISLSSSDEAYALVSQALENFANDRKNGKTPRSVVFFLGRETFLTTFNKDLKYNYGEAQVVSDNTKSFDKSVTLLGVGSLVENAILAQQALEKDGIGSIVINPSMMNNPDLKTIGSALKKTNGKVVTVEDHRVVGGFGALLAHELVLKDVDFKMRSLGIGEHFGRSAYTSNQLYDANGLGIVDIVKSAKSLL